jgi:hypothetical protein
MLCPTAILIGMRIARWLVASTILLGSVAAAVMMINISRRYRTPQGVEPAKVTDWMQAWGSIVTIVASLAAAAFTAVLLLHEMREARAARQDATEERAQAADDRAEILRDRDDDRKRFARAVSSVGPFLTYYPAEDANDAVFVSEMKVDLNNRGAAAVTSLTVRVEFPDGTPLSDWYVFGDLTPDLQLQPGQSQRRVVGTTYAEHKRVTRDVFEPDFLRVKLLFRDANGRTWLRVNDEDPVPQDDEFWYRTPIAELLPEHLRQH